MSTDHSPAGWSPHEITDGGGRFQVLVRRTARRAAPSAQKRSIAPGGSHSPGAIERSLADQNLDFPGVTRRGHKSPGAGPVNADHDPAAPVAFRDLPSVCAMGTGRASIIVGFDTEFTTTADGRVIASYQFATPDPVDPSAMVEVIILPLGKHRLSLHTALWEVVKAARLYQSPLVPDGVDDRGVTRRRVLDESRGSAKEAADAWAADPSDWQARADALAAWRVPVVLACHYGSADLTTYRTGYVTDHLVRLTSAAGGLVTLLPFRLQRGDGQGGELGWWQPLSVSVRDTMAQAPAGGKALRTLGENVGVPKIDVPAGWIEDMLGYRAAHLQDFLEYGINDAVIVVEYLARLWGDGVLPPVTLSGGAASSLVSAGQDYFGVSSAKDFRLRFAGLVAEDGVGVVDDEDALSFYAKRERRPVDGPAEQLTAAYAKAYHGGLNACPAPGYWPGPTVDIDAQNAYPTAMADVEDIDWEAGAIADVVHEQYLSQDDVPEANTAFVGFVSFEFPHSVAFPCIPVLADGTLIYPRTSEGIAGAWVCGPELWLALRLGAKVFCELGYRARVATCPDGGPSRVLRHGVKQLIDDRGVAKEVYGKGSLEETTLKTAVNSIYGKTAQDVSEQSAWNAYAQEMDAVGGSAISSPYHAATTTSIVRAQLLATMNEITDSGGHVYSVTTDGFITDWTAAQVEELDLYGLTDRLHAARDALTGDPTIWEAKHHQDDLVNVTTRGNVSLSLDGVCAHNGIKRPAGIEEDSYEDRLHLLTLVVTRDGRVPNEYIRFPSFSELSRKEDRKEFLPSHVSAPRSMDFDLKRRPELTSMKAAQVPLPDGTCHEMATFTTLPWDTVEECLHARELGREIAKNGCLRTVDQWQAWHLKFAHGKGRRIVTPHRTLLMSIVIAHRQRVVTIPTLASADLTVAQKLDWLGQWGLGTVSAGDWKNARRPERASQALPLDALEPYLARMLAMPAGVAPGTADGVTGGAQ